MVRPPLQVTAVGGVATFSGLGVDPKAGSPYTLAASDTTNGAITGATSNTFTISASSANKLAFTIQPGNGTAGSALSTQPVVTVEDGFGNPVTTGSGSTDTIKVTLSSQTFSGGSTTAWVTAVGGVATFSGLGVNTTAGSPYTLAASDTTNGAIARCDLEHLYDFGQFGQQVGLHHPTGERHRGLGAQHPAQGDD